MYGEERRALWAKGPGQAEGMEVPRCGISIQDYEPRLPTSAGAGWLQSLNARLRMMNCICRQWGATEGHRAEVCSR